MAEKFNDGKAFSYQNTGESVMIFDRTVKVVADVKDQGLVTTLGLTSLNQSTDVVSGEVYQLDIAGVKASEFKHSIDQQGDTAIKLFCDTTIVEADVHDESAESAGIISSRGTVVAGATFEANFIAWHLKPIILKKTRQTSSNFSRRRTDIKIGMANTQNITKTRIINPLNNLFASVYTLEDKIVIKNGSAQVDDIQVVAMGSGTNILEPLTATVEDYKPPTWGSTGSGSGVKSMMVIVQKMTYANIYMTFDDTKITEVLGLPQGMYFDAQSIKGSPLTSGTYNVQIKLDNLRTLEMTLQVPELPREL